MFIPIVRPLLITELSTDFFCFPDYDQDTHGRCVRLGEDDKNPRTLNVRYDIEIIRDVPITHAKMTMMSQLYN